MSESLVSTDVRNNVAVLTLNGPPAHCLSSRMIEALNTAFEDVSERSDVGSIVITAEGDKVFALGADVKEVAGLDARSNAQLVTRVGAVLDKVLRSGKPTIAAINGAAMGGGLELALHCDFRIATEKARFAVPEINLGLIPGAGAVQLLPKLIAFHHAKWLLYTGEIIEAERALAIGLIDRLTRDNETLKEETMRIASALSLKAPLAYGAIKTAVRAGMESCYSDARKADIGLFEMVCNSKDSKEGIKAFLEKRPPLFKGE